MHQVLAMERVGHELSKDGATLLALMLLKKQCSWSRSAQEPYDRSAIDVMRFAARLLAEAAAPVE